MTGGIVELAFDISDTEFPLVRASKRASCELRIEEVRQRSDGSILEYVTVTGAETQQVLDLVQQSPDVLEARLVTAADDEAVFEFISESPIATALADNRTRFTNIVATAGEGQLTAEVPPHVDASTVIDAFLDQYPDASLVARRETERESPTLTESQFHDQLLADLTDRQLQALRTAYANGYFDWPRETTTEEVADELGVATSTFSQHLRVAERKLLDGLFAE